MLLAQGMRVHHMLVWTVMVMVMVKVDGVLWHSRRVMVMVKVDGELWPSRRFYVLVSEVMLHHGEPDGVVNEVMEMELGVVVGSKMRAGQGPEARGRRHPKRTWRRIPRLPRHRSHTGPPALRVLELPEIL